MTKSTAEKFAADLKALAERLDKCEQVRRYDTVAEKQAWALAHNLLDLAESFRTFLEDQLPRLHDASLSCTELDDVLGDIGEEFRHILWHIHSAEFYAYLVDKAPPESPSNRDPP